MHRRRIHLTTSAAALPAGFKKRQLTPKPMVGAEEERYVGGFGTCGVTVFADVDKEAKTLKCKNAPPNATKTIHSCSAWAVPTIETEPLKPRKRTVLEPLKIPSHQII